jgi:AcrR family transcriptional regulator
MSSTATSEKSYHHGNLRAALVLAAAEAVHHGGAATFSLRDAARQAGVTPGAAYKHFVSKGALLAEVAIVGFERLNQRVAAALSDVPDDQRLGNIGLSYVAFAADEPHLFSLMFGPSGTDAPRDSIQSPRGGIYDALRAAMAARQGLSVEDVAPADLALAWAVAHGAARLVTDGLWRRDDPRIALAIHAAVAAISRPASFSSSAPQ